MWYQIYLYSLSAVRPNQRIYEPLVYHRIGQMSSKHLFHGLKYGLAPTVTGRRDICFPEQFYDVVPCLACKKVLDKRVNGHVTAWCATKLYESQKLTSTICIPLKSLSNESAQLIVVAIKDRGNKWLRSMHNTVRKGGILYLPFHLFFF